MRAREAHACTSLRPAAPARWSAIEVPVPVPLHAPSGTQGTSTALRKAIADFPGLFVTAAGNEEQNLEVPSNGGPFIPATYDLPNLVTVAASG